MRKGYFDAEGNCLVILSGEQTEPDLPFTTVVDVPDNMGPNTLELHQGKIRQKERVIPPRPVRGPTKMKLLEDRIAALEAIVLP